MKKKVFIVVACRYGDVELHSYVVGVYTKLSLAKKSKEAEEDYRGGKYTCYILKTRLNLIGPDTLPTFVNSDDADFTR